LSTTLREVAFSEIRDLVYRSVSVFGPNDILSRVLGALKEADRYEAVVASDGSYGLITIRDLLDVDQPSKTKVNGVWRSTGSVASSSTVIDVAGRLVRNNVRALPVVEDGEVVGIISQVELVSSMDGVSELNAVPAKEFIRSPVWSLDIDERIAYARRLMLERGISHIPVVEYGRLVGVVTAETIVHSFIIPASKTTDGDRIEGKVPRFPGEVNGIMDIHPLTMGPEASALDVVRGFQERGKSACFVTDARGTILGIITPRELMRALLRFMVEKELPVYIMGLSDEDFFERAAAEEKVRRVVRRGMKFRPDITEVSIRIKGSQSKGNRTRYDLTARALSPDDQINAEAEGWDLLKVFDELCEKLGNAIGRSKPGTPGRVRSRRSRRAS
jgi:predicted transcriptional regulator/ribosome-associated translation inhibitor RaiA